ncbi:MAG: hypothetical protein IT260_17490 [Saprospiraceae bacterium]|nr:hypothetical protein [Saprospiraceae bacterium]
MKLFFPLLFLLAGAALSAQTESRNSLSLSSGPNWFCQFSERTTNEYSPRTGYQFGLDYTRSLGRRWEAGLLLRYNVWHSNADIRNLQWPSEVDSNGVWHPDPSLPHALRLTTTDKVWQALASLRYLGPATTWRWYAGLDAGISMHAGAGGDPSTPRLTLGVGGGLEWRPPTQHFGLFAQPVARYVFKANDESPSDYRFLALALELGGRWHF